MTAFYKFLVGIMCAFIPTPERRKKFRRKMFAKIEAPAKKKVPGSRYITTKVDANTYLGYPINPLTHIFLSNEGKTISKWHHYFPIYHKHFSRFVGCPVNVLEIGVSKGGSLKMWKKYFGNKAQVYGVDIDPNAKAFEDKEEGIHVFIGDQSDRVFLENLMRQLPSIDILIDDGGHTTHQQITTFSVCYDKISDNGVFLCEDLHTNYWPQFVDSTETFVEHAKKHIDCLNSWFIEKDLGFWEEKDHSSPIPIPLFTHITHSITFYNSIIVFEKERASQPFSERR